MSIEVSRFLLRRRHRRRLNSNSEDVEAHVHRFILISIRYTMKRKSSYVFCFYCGIQNDI